MLFRIILSLVSSVTADYIQFELTNAVQSSNMRDSSSTATCLNHASSPITYVQDTSITSDWE